MMKMPVDTTVYVRPFAAQDAETVASWLQTRTALEQFSARGEAATEGDLLGLVQRAKNDPLIGAYILESATGDIVAFSAGHIEWPFEHVYESEIMLSPELPTRQGWGTLLHGAALTNIFRRRPEVFKVVGRSMRTNQGAAQVMRKLGLTHEGTLRAHVKRAHGHIDLDVFSILRTEWSEGHSASPRVVIVDGDEKC
ncbi:GNAT family N-acetyltransferase [Streptomyces sp. NPDC048514]|uniref:GNAT family N-acetyltransferase n=1 Tax=Streptomyces sp. NPDC048514 TaxID=3365564 RepID=UPI0037178F91